MGDALLEGEHPYGVKPQGNLLHNHEDGAPVTNLLDVSLGRLRQLDDAGISACTCYAHEFMHKHRHQHI